MRQLLLTGSRFCTLFLAFPALVACGSAAVDTPGPAPVDPRIYQDAGRIVAHVRSPEEVVRAERETAIALLTSYAEDGFKAAAPLMDPEGNLSFPGLSEATDRVGALKVLGDLFGAFSSRKLTVGRVFQPQVTPHVVIVEWSMAAIQTGEWMGVKPAQKPVQVRGLSLYWFDPSGLVSDSHVYFDVGATLAQLGAAPKGVEVPAATALATDVVVGSGSEAEKRDVALVTGSWDALEARSETGYLGALADDVEVFRLDRAAPERGKAERKKFFKWALGGIGSLSQTPLNAWGVGPYVIEEYSVTGVHSGPLLGAPASGHALRLHFVDIDEVKDGKVIRTWTYGNSFELYAETGLVPAAAPVGR